MEENKQKKKSRLFDIILGVIEACLLLVLSIGLFRSCSMNVSSYNEIGVSVKEAPSLVVEEKKNGYTEGTSAPSNFTKKLKIVNKSRFVLRMACTNQAHTTLYYTYEISVGETFLAPYTASQNCEFYIESKTYDFLYFVSDDSNAISNTDEYTLNFGWFEGSYLYVYDSLNSKNVYLNTARNISYNTEPRLWTDAHYESNDFVTEVHEISFGQFQVDLVNEYANFGGVFSKISYEYYREPSNQYFGFAEYVSIYAVGKNLNNENYTLLLATSRDMINPSLAFTLSNSGYPTFVTINSSVGYNPMPTVKLMPYLQSSKLTSVSSFGYISSSIAYPFRDLFLNEKPANEFFIRIVSPDVAYNLWANFGDLLLVVLLSILPIASIRILPFITIGALVIAPLLCFMVSFVLGLFKK